MEHFNPSWLQLAIVVVGLGAAQVIQIRKAQWQHEQNRREIEAVWRALDEMRDWKAEIERAWGESDGQHASYEKSIARHEEEIRRLWERDRRS